MAYNENYILSENIKVFPCAYRGQNGNTIFDPEARLNTEYNFTHTSTSFKKSYIVKWTDYNDSAKSKLCCVIGGYYFEITGKTVNNLADQVLCIYIKPDIVISGNTKTSILYAVTDETTTDFNLDVKDTEDDNYYFMGLKILPKGSDKIKSVYTTLQVATNTGASSTIKYDEFLPNIQSGTGTTNFGTDTEPNILVTAIEQEPQKFNLDTSEEITGGATGEYAVSLNGKTLASGKRTLAHGTRTRAIGNYSHAEGNNTLASGTNSHTEGNSTLASNESAHAEGGTTTASGVYSHAEGDGTTASEAAAHAEGYHTESTNGGAHSEGNTTHASGAYSHTEGQNTYATKQASHAEGVGTHADGDGTHTEGYKTNAIGKYSHAEGEYTSVTGTSSHSEGQDTTAHGKGSHAEGYNTATITKNYSDIKQWTSTASYNKTDIVEYNGACYSPKNDGTTGEWSIAKWNSIGNYAHAEGDNTIAFGHAAHAEGTKTQAAGIGAHTEGFNTIANGNYAHAEGISTEETSLAAIGVGSHIEGENTSTLGRASHAEGFATTTDEAGNYSHTEGWRTKATATAAHAEGEETLAQHTGAHTSGYHTKSSRAHQTVVGKYNTDSSDALFIIGNGHAKTGTESEDTRTNVFEVETSQINLKENTILDEGKHLVIGTIDASASGVANYISAGRGYGNTSGKEGIKVVCCDQADCVSGLGQDLASKGSKTIGGYNFCIAGSNSGSDQGSISFVTHIKDSTTYRELGYFDDNAGTVKFVVNGAVEATGSISCGTGSKFIGTADKADCLTSNAGDSTHAIYFSDGKPNQCSDTLDHNISGNASTATNATNDGAGNEISSTYAKLASSNTFNGDLNTFKGSVQIKETRVTDANGTYTDPASGVYAAIKGNGPIILGGANTGGISGQSYFIKVAGPVEASYFNATSFNATSDKRLKENIIEYKSKKSILDLPIYKYDFINGKKNQIGCLAQDLQEICPEIVSEDNNGYLSIQESKIVYLLLEEVKKLRKEIETLKK